MRFLKTLFWIIISLLSLFLLFLLFSFIDDYRPKPEELIFSTSKPEIITDSVFQIVSWNLGYAGLDESMDFFYDGGEQVRPKKVQVEANVRGILSTISDFPPQDFYLFQEVDVKSKRSYRINQFDMLAEKFSHYQASYGKNYDVAFVPIPPLHPMGKVESGLETLSKFLPHESVRHSFPGNYSWPMSMYMLDRCFLVNRYQLENGKKLTVINTHNSAYDDGTLRTKQMEYLKDFLISEYKSGSYVLVGGDWNQCPSGFVPEFSEDVFDNEDLTYTPANFPDADWKWAFDPTHPTNRRVKLPYKKGETATTMIDYFLLSPNIEILDVHGMDLGFKYSDHQPVFLRFKLNSSNQ